MKEACGFHARVGMVVLRSIIFAIWAVVSTLAVFHFMTHTGQPTSQRSAAAHPLTEHKTESLAIALYRDNRVFGHFVTRVEYSTSSSSADKDIPPVSLFIEDSLQELIPRANVEQLVNREEEALDALGNELVEILNARHSGLSIERIRFSDTRLSLRKAD